MSTTDKERQERRRQRNNKSRNRAEHFGEEWTTDEVSFLLDEFPKALGNPEAEELVAEILGRTIESCRQYYYVARRGNLTAVSQRAPSSRESSGSTYLGVYDDPEDRWWEVAG